MIGSALSGSSLGSGSGFTLAVVSVSSIVVAGIDVSSASELPPHAVSSSATATATTAMYLVCFIVAFRFGKASSSPPRLTVEKGSPARKAVVGRLMFGPVRQASPVRKSWLLEIQDGV